MPAQWSTAKEFELLIAMAKPTRMLQNHVSNLHVSLKSHNAQQLHHQIVPRLLRQHPDD